MVCENAKDVSVFFKDVCRRGFRSIVLKYHHRDIAIIRRDADIAALDRGAMFPVLAEAAYPVKSSPVAHAIRWNGRTAHLFTLRQMVSRFRYRGARNRSGLSSALESRIQSIVTTIAESIDGFEGVIGVDFVVTPADEVLVVDVNPRFNSSTYPFCFLERFGLDWQHGKATYQIVADRPVRSLSAVFGHRSLLRFSRDGYGVLPFNPVVDFDLNIVRKWSCLIVGRNDAEHAAARASLNSTLGRLPSLDNPRRLRAPRGCLVKHRTRRVS